ncbi:MAG: molybdopterin molybdotransferase MoeA [Deltaproteobacteria bacterium]|nr:molybdopterin molybdotransferase MoeA [Deltaproteobacteria bacterium]MBW2308623.1 molybdopterin molybdotransferase MoeA [Deltaproteobacteria bacterium]
MIPLEQAQETILKKVELLGTERVDIMGALGRVLAEDIYATRILPPWDNSAMDGYAVRCEDITNATRSDGVTLRVVEFVPAGRLPQRSVKSGEAVKIMTGAPMPEGADAVVMVEETRSEREDEVLIFQPATPGQNVRRAGEDVRQGGMVLSRGTLVGPAEVGMMAALGRSIVSVHQRPLVAILSNGDELVDVDEMPAGHQIISANCYSLTACVLECGAVPLRLGIARDTVEDIRIRLKEGLRADVILISAGVSMGEKDLVNSALEDLGFDLHFWKVAIKPGKPTAFGILGSKLTFGLPGNPVSAMVTFELFVRPALRKMMGHNQLFRPTVEAIMDEDYRQKRGRKNFLRVVLSLKDGKVHASLTGEQGSGILRSMVLANGLAIISEETTKVRKGEKIRVYLLRPLT